MNNINVEKLLEVAPYYVNKVECSQLIKIPPRMKTHHFILVVILSAFETQLNTYCILPILGIFISHLAVIKDESNGRVISRCIDEELDLLESIPDCTLTEEDKNIIFNDISAAVSDTGFIYTRSVLLTRSYVLGFLIYFSTLGILSII